MSSSSQWIGWSAIRAITEVGLRKLLGHKTVIALLFLSWAPVIILGLGFFAMGTQVTKQSMDPKEIIGSRMVPLLALPAEPHMIFSQLLGREQVRKVIDKNINELLPLFWRISFYQFTWLEGWILLLMALAIGPYLITPDLRSGSIPLYFSKQIRPIDYFLGKAGIVTAILAMSFLVPGIVLYLISFFFFPNISYLLLTIDIFLRLVILFILLDLLLISILFWIGSSCKTKWVALALLLLLVLGTDFSIAYLSHLSELYPGNIQLGNSFKLLSINNLTQDICCSVMGVNDEISKLDGFIRRMWLEDLVSGESGKLGNMKKFGTGNPECGIAVGWLLYVSISMIIYVRNIKKATR